MEDDNFKFIKKFAHGINKLQNINNNLDNDIVVCNIITFGIERIPTLSEHETQDVLNLIYELYSLGQNIDEPSQDIYPEEIIDDEILNDYSSDNILKTSISSAEATQVDSGRLKNSKNLG